VGPPGIAPFIELERSSTTTTLGGSQTDGSAATARLVAASPIIAIAAHALVRMSRCSASAAPDNARGRFRSLS
jgi:hypothetical protein